MIPDTTPEVEVNLVPVDDAVHMSCGRCGYKAALKTSQDRVSENSDIVNIGHIHALTCGVQCTVIVGDDCPF